MAGKTSKRAREFDVVLHATKVVQRVAFAGTEMPPDNQESAHEQRLYP